MSLWLLLVSIPLLIWLVLWMLAQKPETNVQQLIHQRRYAEAVAESDRQIARMPRDLAARIHRAEALKLLGRYEDALAEYESALRIDPRDAAASEGVALTLARLGRDLDRARRLMEETIATHPEIQEFQALALAWILLRSGKRDEALRLFDDNVVLLQTRFRDDYTDPDPLLAETLSLFADLSEESGDKAKAAALREQAAAWS
jgi:cytochrome c-type biogenesis protein CcmH/NrfG